MTETFRCDDKQGLVAYLYDEIGAEARAEVDRHLQRCAACAAELAALGDARLGLAAWQPPDADLGFTIVPQPATPVAAPARGWASVPVWAQAAAAALVLAVGLGAANLQVRYDEAGLVVTTGWMAPPPAAASPVPAAAGPTVVTTAGAPVSDEAWREALAALETRLRADMATARPAAVERAAPASADADALLARVTALIEESELRQRQELAYRLTQFNRDMEMQRRADLVRIERGVGQIEGRTGAEVARQREMLNYLVRVAQRPQ